jgi:hypothetical protein
LFYFITSFPNKHPKIHKKGPLKFRPIVSNIGAPAEKLSKWIDIDGEMKKLHPPKGYGVENSYEFVEKIKNVKIDDDEVLVSFDVVELYPNVPIEETLRSIKTWLSTEIQEPEKFEIYYEAVETCMNQRFFQFRDNQRFFQFRDNVYKLNYGTSMGNLLWP